MTQTTLFSSSIGDIPVNMAFINNLAATTDPTTGNDSTQGYQPGSTWINTTGSKAWICLSSAAGAASWVLINGPANNPVEGVGAGYKVARGVHQQAAAADTVATGLATVVAVVASFRDAPTVNQLFLTASIGDQNGNPVAGSVIISTYKPTATGNVTPAPATVFTDNLNIDWIAIGT